MLKGLNPQSSLEPGKNLEPGEFLHLNLTGVLCSVGI